VRGSSPIDSRSPGARRPPVGPDSAPSHIFVTDLDGTLLDHDTYSWEPAAPALAALARLRLPVVLCSSKTLAEMEELQRELAMDAPMIAENGAVVTLPARFPGPLPAGGRARGSFRAYGLAPELAEILPVLHGMRREQGLAFAGFSDWDEDEVAARTGLPIHRARQAKRRSATEPILWTGDREGLARFRERLQGRGLSLVQGGRFQHVSAGADKGRALGWLRERYAQAWPGARTVVVALGDSPNDASMLSSADVAVVVPAREPRSFSVTAPKVVRPERPGPAGWCVAVLDILGQRSSEAGGP
jgi:mannosyl-3-phosphoglycerate phosphatase